MAGTGIAPYIESDVAALIVSTEAGAFDPLRAVAAHVASKALGFAIAYVGTPQVAGWPVVIDRANQWLVEHYVREDFCGLCGRVTDHRGEH